MNRKEEFYIGWKDKAPSLIASRVRRVVVVLALLAAAVSAVAAISQRAVDRGIFEFGRGRVFEGVIYEMPIPMLHVTEPKHANLILVGAGKHGIPEWARGHEGLKVRFAGSLVYRDEMMMVEMNAPESFEVIGDPQPGELLQASEVIGPVALTGELVDTKCWFGVMRPATGKVHRACAIRCLSGGAPPGLLLRDEQGNAVTVMLTGADGKPLDFDVQWAALPVEATGRLEINDGIPILYTAQFERKETP